MSPVVVSEAMEVDEGVGVRTGVVTREAGRDDDEAGAAEGIAEGAETRGFGRCGSLGGSLRGFWVADLDEVDGSGGLGLGAEVDVEAPVKASEGGRSEDGVTFSNDSSRLSPSGQSRSWSLSPSRSRSRSRSRSTGNICTKCVSEPGVPAPPSVPPSDDSDTEWNELIDEAGACFLCAAWSPMASFERCGGYVCSASGGRSMLGEDGASVKPALYDEKEDPKLEEAEEALVTMGMGEEAERRFWYEALRGGKGGALDGAGRGGDSRLMSGVPSKMLRPVARPGRRTGAAGSRADAEALVASGREGGLGPSSMTHSWRSMREVRCARASVPAWGDLGGVVGVMGT